MRPSLRLWISTLTLVVGVTLARAADHGDAPAPYPTAEHTVIDEYLGHSALDSADDPEVPPWTGSDDDDGISSSSLIKGEDAVIYVRMGVNYPDDDVAVWIDWNHDGDWDDAGERVIWAGKSGPDGPLPLAINPFTVSVPSTAVGDAAPLRARIWDTTAPGDMLAGDPSPDARTDRGEVEDHLLPYLGTPEGPEIDLQRDGESLANGVVDEVGTFREDAVSSVGWTLANLGHTNALSVTGGPTISGESGCTATLSAAPSASVAPLSSTDFTVDITPEGGPFSFDLTVESDDADEGSTTLTVWGEGDVLTGTYLISNDPAEGPDYPDLGAAFDALGLVGMSGDVVLEVSEGTGPYTSTPAHQLGPDPVVKDSPGDQLTIRPEPGEHPVIEGSSARTWITGSRGVLAFDYPSHVVVEGLELSGMGEFGIGAFSDTYGDASDVTIRGCSIHGSVVAGIQVLGNGVAIPDVTLENNMIWDAAFYGTSNGGAISFFNVGSDTVVRHNTVLGDPDASGSTYLVAHWGGGSGGLADLSYNVLVASDPGQVFYGSVGSYGYFLPEASDHNVFFRVGEPGFFADLDGSWVDDLEEWQDGGLDAASTEDDPVLADLGPGSEDLHLTAASYAALDLADGSTSTHDIDGDERIYGFGADIGADEFPVEPALRALLDGVLVPDAGVVHLAEGSTVADLDLVLEVADPDVSDTLDLSADLTGSSLVAGLVHAEWEGTGTGGSLTATPTSGSFDDPGDIEVQLEAEDGTGNSTSLAFILAVNGPPVLSVTADGLPVVDGETLVVDEGAGLADLGLDLEVEDPNLGDALALDATLTGADLAEGLDLAEWQASGTGGAISATPTSGTFPSTGLISVDLDASDDQGATDALGFDIWVNAPPSLEVTAGGVAVVDDEVLLVQAGDPVSGLGLSLSAADANGDDTLVLGTLVTDSASITGFVAAEWEASDSGGAVVAAPGSGTFSIPGPIEVEVEVDDGMGGSQSLCFTIWVNGPPEIEVTMGSTALGADHTVVVTAEDALVDLDLTLSVTDPNTGDDLVLGASLTNGSLLSGLVEAEWEASGSGGSIEATPATGVFTDTGLITVSLSAVDDRGGAAEYAFDIWVNAHPILTVRAGILPVGDGDVVLAQVGDPVAHLGLALSLEDVNSTDSLWLAAVLPEDVAIEGLVESQWTATGTGGAIGAAPVSGTLSAPGSIEVFVFGDDGMGGYDGLELTLAVNGPPVVAVTADGLAVEQGDLLLVQVGEALEDLGLVLSASDPNSDELTLLATPADGAIVGSVDAEWEAGGSGVVTASPTTGTLSTAGRFEVEVEAEDPFGGSDLTDFVLAVNGPPSITVSSGATSVAAGGSVAATAGDPISSLNLRLEVVDGDEHGVMSLTATVTDSAAITGFSQAEWEATGSAELISADPVSGTLLHAGTHEVAVHAEDGQGASADLAFTIEVGPAEDALPVLAAPTSAGDLVVSGTHPDYQAVTAVGGSLGLALVASDPDPGDLLTLAVEATGGSLDPEEAGLVESIPRTFAGTPSPATATLSGTAAVEGTVELRVTVDDGRGGADAYTLTLDLEAEEPSCGCQPTRVRWGWAWAGLLLPIAGRRRRLRSPPGGVTRATRW